MYALSEYVKVYKETHQNFVFIHNNKNVIVVLLLAPRLHLNPLLLHILYSRLYTHCPTAWAEAW